MKSTDRILAGRYARAFDSLSADAPAAYAAWERLRMAESALAYAGSYMTDPAVPSTDKQQFVQDLFGEDKLIGGFLGALLSAKRYYLLPLCVSEVAKLSDLRAGIVRAQVETAFALSAEQKKQVELALSKFTGKTAKATFEVKPQLLGGIKMRVEDTLIDGSFQAKFERLKEVLTK